MGLIKAGIGALGGTPLYRCDKCGWEPENPKNLPKFAPNAAIFLTITTSNNAMIGNIIRKDSEKGACKLAPDGAHQKPVRSTASRAFCKAKGDKCLRKVVMVLAILSIFSNLLGCSKKAGYTAADLSVLSTVCGHMCRNYSYSFSLIKDNGTWLFSTNCFVNNKEFSTEIENCPITEEETLEFLRIVDEQKLISSIRRYRKPALSRHFFVCDETMYSSLIRFANGAEYNAEMSVGTEMTDFFYRLAEKYF